MAKDLTPHALTLSASFRTTLDSLKYDYNDKVATMLLYRRSWYGDIDAPRVYTHQAVGDYISLNGEGEVTYLPAARMETALAAGMEWNKKYRQAGRPAKIVRSLLVPAALEKLNDVDFEKFTNNLRAKIMKDQQNIRIVSGEDIRHWYSADNYAYHGTGTLRTSCMRYDKCQPYMDFYVNNPDVINMVIMTDSSGLLIARALLWNTEQVGWVFDRVYGNDVSISILRDWAVENGYPVRTHNSYEGETLWNLDGEQGKQLFLTVNLLTGSSRGYPYCDTFKFLFINHDEGTTRVKNHQRGAHANYELISTEGYPFIVLCSECGEEGEQSSLRDGLCYTCRLANLCVVCESGERGHGPEGRFCIHCAESYLCRQCNEYRYDENGYGQDRHRYLYPSYYLTSLNDPAVCRHCYEQWLTAQVCAICNGKVSLRTAMSTLLAGMPEMTDRATVCDTCYTSHACNRCGTVDPDDLQSVRFNVNSPYRQEYREVMCRDCQGRRCSYCSNPIPANTRCEYRESEETYECQTCRVFRLDREQREATRLTATANTPAEPQPAQRVTFSGDTANNPWDTSWTYHTYTPPATPRYTPTIVTYEMARRLNRLQLNTDIIEPVDVEDELDLPF